MTHPFEGFDLSRFWEVSEYANEAYVEPPPTRGMIESIETELGYKLPKSYIALMMKQNGGIPRNTNFPTTERTSWAEDHVAISGIMGIGRSRRYSLCGEIGSLFMQEEWDYPRFGICICNCPSAGHDMIMLDYRECGPEGEPCVVHVDQECDYAVTFLARDFETFIRGLVNDSVYDTSAEDLKKSLEKIESGAFSNLLSELIAKFGEPGVAIAIRKTCRDLTLEKGYFALHADEQSHLIYDIQFLLYTSAHSTNDIKQYFDDYSKMIALVSEGEFTTGGYAPAWIEEWYQKRRSDGDIILESDRLNSAIGSRGS